MSKAELKTLYKEEESKFEKEISKKVVNGSSKKKGKGPDY